MEKLEIEFENCFGIKKLNTEFNFTVDDNINVIYAKNGLMKTSFTKVFKKFQDDKQDDIKDMIFNNTPITKNIKVDGNDILKEEIFVINSFEKDYESDSISSLLINDSIKAKLVDIIRIKNQLFNALEEKSGLDLKKPVSTKGFFQLEEQILKDFGFTEQSFLQNIESINLEAVDYNYSNIKYSTIFHKAVLNNIKKANFQSSIRAYLERSDEIYEEYTFFERGNFNLPKLKSIEKELKTSSFFVRRNKIHLDGSGEFENLEALTNKINEIENRLQETSEFKAIDKALGTKDGKDLKDLIENNIEILEELTLVNLENFRIKLWLSYLKVNESIFNDLKERYIELQEEISALNLNETLWQESVDIFNSRFHLPFTMHIDNPISSITGESLPKIIFNFTEGTNPPISLNRDELETGDTLSQGERRALYLLNIIFDIEKRKKENQKTLFIIDDIADSFDYKNKYAIIEYLNETSKENNFYLIILSHNFDFYRTVASRLDVNRDKKFHAIKTNHEIKIEKEHYQNKPFDIWKKMLSAGPHYGQTYNDIDVKKHILALIPFVRNLIEYSGVDNQVNTFPNIDKDYLLLTNLLHLKDDTQNIPFEQLKKIYGKYLGEDDFDSSINLSNDMVYDCFVNIADNHISDDDIKLENKIILAIAIRLKAESFMKTQIQSSAAVFSWKNGNSGGQADFLNYINTKGNQTRELFNGFRKIGQNEEIKTLESVNIMTPENIHLNSFMYEPLLDMDIVELKKLYEDVKSL